MAEEQNAVQNEQPKKKKSMKWLKPVIVLGVVTVILVAPIAALYICFYDGTYKSVEKDPNFEAKDFLQEKLISALDTTKDDGQVAVKVSEDDFNQIFLAASDGVKGKFPALNNYLDGADVKTGDDQYVFSVNAHLGKIFKSRARLYTELTSEEIDGEECISFKVDDVKLGRVSFLNTFKKNKILKALLSDDTINGFLSGTGFSLKSDIEQNNRIYYPKAAIANDISIFGAESEGTIYGALLSECYHQNMFNLDFSKEGFKGGIDLTKAHDNAAFVSPEKANTVDFIALQQKVQDIINAGLPSDKVDLLYKFLIVGFERLNEQEQNEMLGFDLSGFGIPDIVTYKGIIIDYDGSPHEGYIVRPQTKLEDYIANQANASECDPGDTIAIIEESELNKTLMSSDVIGTPRVFVHALKDGSYKVNTFGINNMYANIYNNTVKFAIDLSINGYDTYICLNSTLTTSNTFVMSFIIDDVYYGEMDSSDAFKDQLLNLLFTSFSGNPTLSFNSETRTLNVDIASSVTSEKKTKVEAAGGVDQIITGAAKDDEGTLIFKVHS